MSDLDAIRARHYHITGPDSVCAEDRQPWPCDTATVLAALDRKEYDCNHNWSDAERDAAIERERRLRAALDTKPYEWLDEYAGGKGWEEAMTLMRAAFATTPEGE